MDFAAPWSRALRWITSLACLLLAGITLVGLAWPRGGLETLLLVALPPLVLAAGLLFMVRGYRIEGRELLVLRPLGATRVDLSGLRTASADPQAMRGSIRLFGIGGLFVWAGWFRNRALGRYRVWATDPARAVVLRFEKRVVVVTPDDPARFLARLPQTGAAAVTEP